MCGNRFGTAIKAERAIGQETYAKAKTEGKRTGKAKVAGHEAIQASRASKASQPTDDEMREDYKKKTTLAGEAGTPNTKSYLGAGM